MTEPSQKSPEAREERKQEERTWTHAASIWLKRIYGAVKGIAVLVGILAFAYTVHMDYKEQIRQTEHERRQRYYQAWQTINSAQGKTGSGGRIQALQDLNEAGISLAGVDLSRAWLSGVNLRGADLKGAILGDANLTGAVLALK